MFDMSDGPGFNIYAIIKAIRLNVTLTIAAVKYI